MQSLIGKVEAAGIQVAASDIQKSTGEPKKITAHCNICARAGFRPVIIEPEEEDPRYIAVRSLVAVKDQFQTLDDGHKMIIDAAIKVISRSIFKDEVQQLNAEKPEAAKC
jgi:hypothetical protein